jgi:molybdopterin-guanine dinucleotide biosynthesis protein A
MITEKCNAYILAGGKSRRLGVNKLHVRLGNQSLLERTIATCKEYFEQVKLVAGCFEGVATLGCETVLDSPLAQGPMAGVIASLEDCRTDLCFITAADLPDLNGEIINSLIASYVDQQYVGIIESNGFQPLCGIYHTSSLLILKQAASNKEYSLNKAMRFLNHNGILPSGKKWRNINYPHDLTVGDIHG